MARAHLFIRGRVQGGRCAPSVDLRKETLARLAGLSPREWERRATHALLGPATLADVMALAADHELVHQAALAPVRPPSTSGRPPIHR